MERNIVLMRRIWIAMFAVFAFAVFAPTQASAGDIDFRLSRLCTGDASAPCGINNSDPAVKDFRSLARVYASLLAPMHFQPASTLGQAGFEIAVESKMSFVLEDASYWRAINKNVNQTPSDDGKYSAPDLFATVQLHVRKGLPFSFELEGIVNWLANSELFYVGAGLRWAFTEGWWFMPDISVRAHVGTLIGAPDLSFINVNADLALSYTFGLGGLVSLTPYGGFSFLTNFSSSRPIVVFVGEGNDTAAKEAVFRRQTQYMYRGFAGLELKADYFVLGLEGEFGADALSAGVKIGANF
ncbi:MAG: hypothetical protein WC966_09450 [Bradymonadales bacterium]